MTAHPTGTVTFLFTDIENSTRLAREYPETWETARARHHDILREAIENNNGFVFQIIGDAFCAAFFTAGDALQAAIKAQQGLQGEAWGETAIRVRMGMHTGEAVIDGNDYRGYLTMSLVQRLMSAGHGGQILLSDATEKLLREKLSGGVGLRDMGEHKFKDVPHQIRVFQVRTPGLPSQFPHLRTLEAHPNNLPVQLTSFVGRKKELADVKRLLPNTHILTLIGPGGTGKTRLSIEVASQLLDRYSDGVWMVELASILDPMLVPRNTAIAIGLRDEPQRPVIDMLCDYLREKKMLMILDNCEHLVDACAQMADRILRAAPEIRILTSSREALGIGGEVTYRVPSLGLPDLSHLPPPTSLDQYEAVRLFIDRACSANPSFAVTNENAPFLAQICHRLDGIPLAIELAAAKIRVLSLEQIAKRLDDRFRLLTAGSRTALERHRTLRAAIDWSYNLLPQEEQILYRRLSIFLGGWTLEAAESVCSDAALKSVEILDLLDHLINKSLVVMDEMQTGTRYHMLETIRQFADEKLVESAENDALRDRHLEYFLNLAETAEPHLLRAEQIGWFSQLDSEIENLHTALDWAMRVTLAEPALRLTGALGIYWDMRAYWTEGARWIDQALAKKWDQSSRSEKLARAKTLYQRGRFANALDQLDLMKICAGSALKLYEELEEASGIVYARAVIANHLWRTGDYQESKVLFEQCLDDFQRLHDAWGESYVWSRLDAVAMGLGEFEKILENEQSALRCARAAGDRDRIATTLVGIATELLCLGKGDSVENMLQEASHLSMELGSLSGINRLRLCRGRKFLIDGKMEQARAELRSYVDHCFRVGEKNTQSIGLLELGIIAEFENDLEEVVECLMKGLEIAREIRSPEIFPITLAFLGRIKYQQGDRGFAIRYTHESLEIIKSKEIAGDTVSIIFCQVSGMLLEKQPQRAAQFLGFTEPFWQNVHYPRDPIYDKPYFERFTAAARTNLSEAEFNSEWETGLKMTQEEALDLALKTVDKM